MEQITGYIADSSSWTIALVHPITGAAFTPGNDYGLVATFKNRENDSDANAVIQKATGAGITVSGSNATVTLVRADTADFCECNLHFGIRATHATTGASFTVAERRVKFEKPTTIETTTSVDVITTETPLPFGGVTSYVDEIETLSDYPSVFPPDLNSGYNIKTINNYDITGEGNLDVLNAADLGAALPSAIATDPTDIRAAAQVPALENWVSQGDSWTATTAQGNDRETYPYYLARLAPQYGVNFYNVAIAGQTAQTMVSTFAAQVAPYLTATTGLPSTAFIFAGINDAATRTTTQLRDDLRSLWTSARNAGARVVAFTLPHRTAAGGWTGRSRTPPDGP